MIDPAAVPVQPLHGLPTFRLIASRHPTVGLFDAIANPADLDVVFAIEALTNPRLRDEIGELTLVPRDERVSGPGSTPVMAAFTHLNPEGSRFSDGQYGVYYAAADLPTALAEVSHHRARFLRHTRQGPIEIDLRLIEAPLEAALHDLRDLRDNHPALYHPDDYAAPQRLGRALRATGSWGVAWHSVRYAGGLCVGLFRPRALGPTRATQHLALHWDGGRFTHWYGKQEPQALPPRSAAAN